MRRGGALLFFRATVTPPVLCLRVAQLFVFYAYGWRGLRKLGMTPRGILSLGPLCRILRHLRHLGTYLGKSGTKKTKNGWRNCFSSRLFTPLAPPIVLL